MSDTPTVYIVTAGEYSSYHIAAVFQTEAEAEEYVEWRWGHTYRPDVSIQEWSVGGRRSRTGMWWAFGSRGEESPYLLFDPDGGDREESTTIEPNRLYWEIDIYRHDREQAIQAYQQARRDLWVMLDRGTGDERDG